MCLITTVIGLAIGVALLIWAVYRALYLMITIWEGVDAGAKQVGSISDDEILGR